MSITCLGPCEVKLSRDLDGHRTYNVSYKLQGTPGDDGPYDVMQCPDLPQTGDTFGGTGTALGQEDTWAKCHPDMVVRPLSQKDGEKVAHWIAELKFSTKAVKRCQDTQIGNPLEEPQKISGSFTNKTEEATYDRFGKPLKTSSHEQFRGAHVEFDRAVANVKIEQNVPTLGLSSFTSFINTVNSSTLWGMPKRTIKLSGISFERKLYGVCTYYYTRSFEFDVDAKTFDRYLLDEGTKVLCGHWATEADVAAGKSGWILDTIEGETPDADNPQHFIRYKDRNGENARVILNGAGLPADTTVFGTGSGGGSSGTAIETEYGYRKVEKYAESNFLLLGIPSSL